MHQSRHFRAYRDTAMVLASAALLATAAGPAWARDRGRRPRSGRDALEARLSCNQEKYRELVNRLETTVAEAQKELERLRDEKAALLNEVEATGREVFDLRMRNEERRQELEERRTEAAALESALREQEKTMAALERRLSDLMGRVPAYEEAVRTEQLLKRKDGEIAALKAKLEALTREKQALEKSRAGRIAALESEVREIRASFADLEDASEQLVARFQTVNAALKREQHARREEQRRASGLEEQLAAAREDLSRARERVAALENTNGLLRQFFPRGRDLSTVTEEEIQHVVDLLNNRPRKRLGYRTPAEALRDELVALEFMCLETGAPPRLVLGGMSRTVARGLAAPFARGMSELGWPRRDGCVVVMYAGVEGDIA